MVFLSCDWGSTSLRLRLVERPSGKVLRERRSDRGSSSLVPPGTPAAARAEAFAACLGEEVAALGIEPGWGPCPVVASGMVTSAHGWVELRYAATPLALDGSGLVTAAVRLPDGRPVTLVSGLTDGTDVMRGEECELLGLTRWPGWPDAAPGGDATVVLPGTHCKHVQVGGGAVCGFRTYMTGELFALLRQHSVLRHSLGSVDRAPVADPGRLREGALLVRELGLAAALFRVRTAALLRGMDPDNALAYLNGILVGAEFAQGPAPVGRLVLAAGAATSAVYVAVLEALGWGDRLTVVPAAVAACCSAMGHAVMVGRSAG